MEGEPIYFEPFLPPPPFFESDLPNIDFGRTSVVLERLDFLPTLTFIESPYQSPRPLRCWREATLQVFSS